MNTKYTPGPLLDAFNQGISDGQEQGELSSGMTYDNPEMNEAYDVGATVGEWIAKGVPFARVIAAAPEMLEALREISALYRAAVNSDGEIFLDESKIGEIADNAIAKAES